jgi:hypothetical protein
MGVPHEVTNYLQYSTVRTVSALVDSSCKGRGEAADSMDRGPQLSFCCPLHACTCRATDGQTDRQTDRVSNKRHHGIINGDAIFQNCGGMWKMVGS